MPTKGSVWGLWLSAGLSIACGRFEEVRRGAVIGGVSEDTAATDSGGAEAGSADSTDSADGAASPFIDSPDAGGLFECDHWTQDCPAGTKCTVWASDGGSLNATRCVPIVPDPDAVGEACTLTAPAGSGEDTCERGALCWNVDPWTSMGVCRGQCEGSPTERRCPDPNLVCSGPRNFPLCVDICCPLERECPPGQSCYPYVSGFQCMPDVSPEDGGEFGDPCAFINVCAPGHFCIGAAAVPGCTSKDGCCNAFCRVGTDTCSALHPAMTCVPWYTDDHAPPGFELTGACTVVE